MPSDFGQFCWIYLTPKVLIRTRNAASRTGPRGQQEREEQWDRACQTHDEHIRREGLEGSAFVSGQVVVLALPSCPSHLWRTRQGQWQWPRLQFGHSHEPVPAPHRYGDCVCPRSGRGVFNSMLIIQKYFHLTDNLNDPIKAAITIRTNPALIDSHVSSQSLAPK